MFFEVFMEPNIKFSQEEMTLLWNALNDNNSHLKSLNQKEREIVKLALKNMNIIPNKVSCDSPTNDHRSEVTNILAHLKIIPKKSGFLKRIVKGIGNFFHLRISSADLQSKITNKQKELSESQKDNTQIRMPEEISEDKKTESISSPNQEKIEEFTNQKEKLSEMVAQLQKKHNELINVRSQINYTDKERTDVEKKVKEWEAKAGNEKDVIKKNENQQEFWKCKATSTNLFNKMMTLKSDEKMLISDYDKDISLITTEYNNLKKAIEGLKLEMESSLTDNADQEQLILEKHNLETFLNTLTEESAQYAVQINDNLEERTRINNYEKEFLFG